VLRRTPERLNIFSDAIFAVLITVLVLDLHPPAVPTFRALLSLWPTWLSYTVSYLFITIVWTNHHHLMHYAEDVTPRLMWFNFGHLFPVPLLPLSTARMAVSELAPQPVAFYAAVFFLVNATYIALIGEIIERAPVTDVSPKGAQDQAPSIDCHFMCFRNGCDCFAEISAAWTWNVLLLPACLPEA
jgi:uncharacterized membrane protein